MAKSNRRHDYGGFNVLATARLKRYARLSAFPAIFLAITCYFSWSAIYGDHGLIAESEHEKLLAQAEKEHKAAEREQAVWERRVIELRAKTLDPDYLDERTRATTYRGRPNEIVVPIVPTSRRKDPH